MYATVALTGKILRDGVPAVGKAILTPNVNTISDLDGNVVLYGPLVETLDNTGAFTINAPATDDPNLRPVNFGYTLKFDLESGSIPTIPEFSLPTATVSIDLTEIVPDPSNPYYVTTMHGPSAYEVAVDNGFVGTEAEWLATLSPDFTIGAVTTGPAGSAASVTITGTNDNPILNFTIPRGDQGNPGTGSVSSVNGDDGPDVVITLASLGGSPVGHTHDDRYYTESEIDTKLATVGNKNDQLKIDAEQSLRLWRLEAQVIGQTQDMSNWIGEGFLTNQDEVNTTSLSVNTKRAISLDAGYAEQEPSGSVFFTTASSYTGGYYYKGADYPNGGWGTNSIQYLDYFPEIKMFIVVANSTIWTSVDDTATWQSRGNVPANIGNNVNRIRYYNGNLYLLGYYSAGTIGYLCWVPATTSGTLTWTTGTSVSGSGNSFLDLIYANGTWVILYGAMYFLYTQAATPHGTAQGATVSTQWVSGSVGFPTGGWGNLNNNLLYANGVWVALSSTGYVRTCDGANTATMSVAGNWVTRVTPHSQGEGSGLSYGNGYFFVSGRYVNGSSQYCSRLYYSADGITWTAYDNLIVNSSAFSSDFVDGLFYFFINGSATYYTSITPTSNANWTTVVGTKILTQSYNTRKIRAASKELVGTLELDPYALPETCNKVYILDSKDAGASVVSYEISLNGGVTWEVVSNTDQVITLGHTGTNLIIRVKFTRTVPTQSKKLYWFIVYAAPAA